MPGSLVADELRNRGRRTKALRRSWLVRLTWPVPRRASTAYLLLFFSGAAGLGYQMVWSRMLATGLGHETPAVLAVIGAFMAGMALGAALLDRVLARSSKPLTWYAALEGVIGVWAAITVLSIPWANDRALQLMGVAPSPWRQWLVAFVFPLLIFLPATAAMGATFPAMERFLSSRAPDRRRVAAVYAVNTFGAVAGTLLSTFVIAPRLGFSRTVLLLGALNVICAIAALVLARQAGATSGVRTVPSSAPTLPGARLAFAVFVTGFLGIGYEVVGTRVLSQVLENTIYSFAAVLSVYLLGTSIGAALFQRFGKRKDPRATLALLLATTALCAVSSIFPLAHAEQIYSAMRKVGDRTWSVLLAEMTVAGAVFLLPTIGMGATFSQLVQLARREQGGVGSAVALNTIGGALAPLVFGVALVPVLGSKWTLVLGGLAYVALTPAFTRAMAFCSAATLLLLPLLPANLHVVTVPPGGRVLAFREGVMAAVAVVEEAPGDRVLRVNNRFQMGGTAAADAQYRGAHIPLLLHPAPRHALFLGLGTGITVGGALLHPGLEIDAVELVPEVADVLPLFAPANRSLTQQQQVQVYVADARRFARATTNRYDVIVADLFHPARDGAGALYTSEHFRELNQCLAPGGLVCQWLPLHQLDLAMTRVICRTFANVFPATEAWLLRLNVDAPVLGLVGYANVHPPYPTNLVEAHFAPPALAAELKRLGLGDTLRLLGQCLGGSNVIDALGPAPLNRDDFPVVTFRAPQHTYHTAEPPYGTLRGVLELTRDAVGADLPALVGPALAPRLRAYAAARAAYLHGQISDYNGRRDEAIDDYVRSAELSEDFTLGYAQCLTIVSLLVEAQPQEARALLERLVVAQPTRPVAKQLLERLFERR